MADFKNFVTELGTGIRELAQKEISGFAEEAFNDGSSFIINAQSDLERWMQQLQNGQLSPNDLASLVRGKKSLLEMKSLTQKGLADAKIDGLKNAIIDLIVNKALGTFLPK